jgi:hypothetical protein
MSMPSSLVAAGNTYNPCLLVAKSKGYRLWAEQSGERLLWNASKDGRFFTGYSPPELLGVIVLWENFGHDWNRQQPDLISELTEKASE